MANANALPAHILLINRAIRLQGDIERAGGANSRQFARELREIRKDVKGLDIGTEGPAFEMVHRVLDRTGEKLAAAQNKSNQALSDYYRDSVGGSVLADYRSGNVVTIRA